MNPNLSDSVMARRRELSGILIFFIFLMVGGAMLWIALDYSNNQFRRAQVKAAVLAREVLAIQQESDHESLIALYTVSVQRCQAAKFTRRAVNRNTGIIKEFLITARKARRLAVETASTEADRELNATAAARYTQLIYKLKLMPLSYNCKRLYPIPLPINTTKGVH